MAEAVEIDDQLSDEIRRLAELRHLSPQEVVREAVSEYATRAAARESFLQEADASWDAYVKDGLHLTGDEMSDWLKAVSTDRAAKMPDCHE